MYNFSVKLRDKEIKFRKWKVKDRTKFKESQESQTEVDPHVFEDALVFDCLEDKDITLTPEEFNYVLAQIRKVSIGDSLHYELKCSECENDYEFDIKIDDLYTVSYKKFGKIKSGDTEFTMGKILNEKYYKENISEFTIGEERTIFDFIMHVHEMNSRTDFTFEDIFNTINEMDIDIANEIFSKWNEMKFTLDDEHDIECPFCKNVENIKFDFLPNFLPDDWY